MYVKQVIKVRSIHEKVANQRRDFLHKLSYHLAKDYSIIAVEDLDIRRMVTNKNKIEKLWNSKEMMRKVRESYE
ncbi:transposase [Lentibacillus sp. L22]|uniref:transposase n=1 Tax=Lentibacillus TaxID=175304 RepID=UPI0022B18350|nr:transposase [Lentibacillus daqui]